MLQFKAELHYPEGVIHCGDWLCFYKSGLVRGTMYDHYCYRLMKFNLTGSKAGKTVIAALNWDEPFLGKRQIGSPTWFYKGERSDPTHFLTYPSPKMRVLCSEAFVVPRQERNAKASPLWLFESIETGRLSPINMWLGSKGGLNFDLTNLKNGRYLPTEVTHVVWSQTYADGIARQGSDAVYVLTGLFAHGMTGMFMARHLPTSLDVSHIEIPLRKDEQITDFEFSKDGKTLVTACTQLHEVLPAYQSFANNPHRDHRRRTSSVRLFSVAWPRITPELEYDFPAHYVSLAEDGMTLAVVGDSDHGDYGPGSDTVTIIDL